MFVLDFAFVKEKLDVECDKKIWHEKYKEPGEDERRDEFLKSRGWENKLKLSGLGKALIINQQTSEADGKLCIFYHTTNSRRFID